LGLLYLQIVDNCAHAVNGTSIVGSCVSFDITVDIAAQRYDATCRLDADLAALNPWIAVDLVLYVACNLGVRALSLARASRQQNKARR
jgi:hypothetical protein